MPHIPKKPQTEDSSTFDPDIYFDRWHQNSSNLLHDNDFKKLIIQSFDLPLNDNYRYVAVAEVSLSQAQKVIGLGSQNGLHGWYRDAENGGEISNPPLADIEAYTDIFRPTTSTPKALIALSSNAKKGSLRASIGQHLQNLYKSHTTISVAKNKTHVNPYLDVWAWTNRTLEWAGPEENTKKVRISHAVLPVLYHHFGCVVPSYEALITIRTLARRRRVLDVGSGNGYWTYMLRRLEAVAGEKKGDERKKLEVVPIDNGTSEWRTVWVGDTVQADAVQWLEKNGGGMDDVLLLVYPVVGNDFTAKTIKAYKGTTIISAGSQNANGFTSFAKETLSQWMEREMPDWQQVLQVPLPSFAAKDEALFAFEKK